jgi:hypothetical protein
VLVFACGGFFPTRPVARQPIVSPLDSLSLPCVALVVMSCVLSWQIEVGWLRLGKSTR